MHDRHFVMATAVAHLTSEQWRADTPTPGIRVVSVLPDMPAHRAGLRSGDRIIAINDRPTPDVDANAELAQLPFRVLVQRGHQVLEFFVTDGPGWPEKGKPSIAPS